MCMNETNGLSYDTYIMCIIYTDNMHYVRIIYRIEQLGQGVAKQTASYFLVNGCVCIYRHTVEPLLTMQLVVVQEPRGTLKALDEISS